MSTKSPSFVSSSSDTPRTCQGTMSKKVDKRSILLFVDFSLLLLSFVHAADAAAPVVLSVALGNETSLTTEFKDLPLVGKCCPLDEAFVKDDNGKLVCAGTTSSSSAAEFSPLFCNFNKTGVLVPGDKRDSFVAIVGDPCQYKKYILFPENNTDDENYLLINGSVFLPHMSLMLVSGVNYCMENVPEFGFRTLVCISEEDTLAVADSTITFYACGLLISVPFLLMTIVAYSITPKLKDVHGKILCHYCGCLTVAFTVLAVTQLGSEHWNDQTCMSVAFVVQFSFVACFFWLNVMCIETWLLIQSHVHRDTYKRRSPKVLFFYYSLWGWGPAAILILISMIMNLSPTIPLMYVKPNMGGESCWFKPDNEAKPYFYVPIGLLLLGNIVLFVITAIKIRRYQNELALRRMARNEESDRQNLRVFRRLKKTFIICVTLFFLMGLNWSIELISWCVGTDSFDWSAFDLINALQGVLVFGLFVLRRPSRGYIWQRIQKLRGIGVAEPEIGSMDLSLL